MSVQERFVWRVVIIVLATIAATIAAELVRVRRPPADCDTRYDGAVFIKYQLSRIVAVEARPADKVVPAATSRSW